MTVDKCASTIRSGLALAELQAQVDAFDHIYDADRPHQGLSGRVTPLTAWQTTAKAEAPCPTRDLIRRPASRPRSTPAPALALAPTDLPDDTVVKKLTCNGVFMLNKVQHMVDGRRGLQQVLVITTGNKVGDKIAVADLDGEILIEHTRPVPGVTYVGNGRPHGPRQDP